MDNPDSGYRLLSGYHSLVHRCALLSPFIFGLGRASALAFVRPLSYFNPSGRARGAPFDTRNRDKSLRCQPRPGLPSLPPSPRWRYLLSARVQGGTLLFGVVLKWRPYGRLVLNLSSKKSWWICPIVGWRLKKYEDVTVFGFKSSANWVSISSHVASVALGRNVENGPNNLESINLYSLGTPACLSDWLTGTKVLLTRQRWECKFGREREREGGREKFRV